jgi:hypothetical protein
MSRCLRRNLIRASDDGGDLHPAVQDDRRAHGSFLAPLPVTGNAQRLDSLVTS